MPKFRAIWHVDAIGCSDVFEADSLEHARQLVDNDEAGEYNLETCEIGDPIECVDILELD